MTREEKEQQLVLARRAHIFLFGRYILGDQPMLILGSQAHESVTALCEQFDRMDRAEQKRLTALKTHQPRGEDAREAGRKGGAAAAESGRSGKPKGAKDKKPRKRRQAREKVS